MATKRKTQLEQDRMTDANITRVIDLLSPGPDKKAITKKEACQILGMSYNTARLDKLIEDYKTQQATTKSVVKKSVASLLHEMKSSMLSASISGIIAWKKLLIISIVVHNL